MIAQMNSKLYLPILIIIMIIIAILSSFVLNTEELLFTSLSEQLTQTQINNVLDQNRKWNWIGYIFIPLFLLIKIALISSALYIGLFLFNQQTTHKKIFTIVTKAEFIFISAAIIKLLWFALKNQYTLEDIQYFYPLSALSIVGHEGLSPWFLYPFQTLNLFELAYWLLLAYFIGKEIKVSTDKAFKIVASSYGSGLLIWMVAVMFFTLNAS